MKREFQKPEIVARRSEELKNQTEESPLFPSPLRARTGLMNGLFIHQPRRRRRRAKGLLHDVPSINTWNFPGVSGFVGMDSAANVAA